MRITVHLPTPPQTNSTDGRSGVNELLAKSGLKNGAATGSDANPSFVVMLGQSNSSKSQDSGVYGLNGMDNAQMRRMSLSQRAQQLKQQIKTMKQMMSMATKDNAKGFVHSLSRLAQELKSIAGELKAAGADSADIASVSAAVSPSASSADSASTSDGSADQGAADQQGGSGDAAIQAAAALTQAAEGSTQDGTTTKAPEGETGQPGTAQAAAGAVGGKQDPDAGLKAALTEMAEDLKKIQRHLKMLLKMAPPDKNTKEEMDRITKDLEEGLKDLKSDGSSDNSVTLAVAESGAGVVNVSVPDVSAGASAAS